MTETGLSGASNETTSGHVQPGVVPSSEGMVRAIGRWSLAALTANCIIGSGVFGCLPRWRRRSAEQAFWLAVRKRTIRRT